MGSWLAALVVLAVGPFQVTGGKCMGGSPAACECLLACPVFGGNPGNCSKAEDKTKVVDRAVQASLRIRGTECDGMKCIMNCARSLGCLDTTVKSRCVNVKEDRQDCDVNCDDSGARRGGEGASGYILLASLATLLAVATA